MKMRLIMAMLAAAVAAHAQTPEPKRVDAIWSVAVERFNRQNDVWFHDGDFPRVVQLLRFHFFLEPTDYEAATNLGWLLESIEEPDSALSVYIQLRTMNPDSPDHAWPEANFYFKKKAYVKIPPILEPTIKDKDPHANTYRTLAHAYERMNMLADSKRVWEQYLSKHPSDGAAKSNLDRVLKKLKEGFSKKS